MEETAGIYARESTYLGRYVQVGIASGRVISVSFPERPDEGYETDHELLDRICAIKVTLRRPTAAGAVSIVDVYGTHPHVPLLGLEVPD